MQLLTIFSFTQKLVEKTDVTLQVPKTATGYDFLAPVFHVKIFNKYILSTTTPNYCFRNTGSYFKPNSNVYSISPAIRIFSTYRTPYMSRNSVQSFFDYYVLQVFYFLYLFIFICFTHWNRCEKELLLPVHVNVFRIDSLLLLLLDSTTTSGKTFNQSPLNNKPTEFEKSIYRMKVSDY